MKVFLFFIICNLLIISCNRIDFSNQEDKSPHNYITDYQLYSCSNASCANKNSFSDEQTELKAGYLTENFKIAARDDLEIILVIDASSSMDDDLKAIGNNMTALLAPIQHKNWRMAFITADHGDHDRSSSTKAEKWQDYQGSIPRFGQFMPLEIKGKISSQKILNKEIDHYQKIFKNTLTRESPDDCSLPPFCHKHNEQPLRALKAAIERSESNPIHKEFFKPNTDTIAIIITDEDERRQDTQNATTATEVLQTYNSKFKGQKKRLFGFSISIQDAKCLQKEIDTGWLGFGSSPAAYGHIVARLADITGGSNISLCEKNYSSSLQDISERTKSLIHSVTLREMFYIPETIQVILIPKQPHISWELYGRSIVFSGDLLLNTKVSVSYEYEH